MGRAVPDGGLRLLLLVVFLFCDPDSTHSMSIQKREANSDQIGPIEGLFDDIGGRKQVDFILVMDRSHSMSRETFYLKEKKIAEAILKQHASLSTSYVRLAVITFAKDVTVVIDGISNPDTAPDKCRLFVDDDKLWDRVIYTQNETLLKGTNMKDAFIQAIELYKDGKRDRPGASKVLLVLTDGKYNKDSDPINEAQELIESHHVTLYAVGIGNWLEQGNVRVVTSQKNGTYLYGRYEHWYGLLTANSNQLTSYGPNTSRHWLSCTHDGNNGNTAGCYCDMDRGIKTYLCYQGFYYNNTTNSCVECPVGMYKNEIGNATECILCPPGTTTETTRSVTKNSCRCTTGTCIDPCDSASCNEHQRCEAINETDYTCVCLEGWQGDDCEENKDVCVDNGDKCLHNSKCVDGLGDGVFTCVCTNWAYEGQYCQNEKNECTDDMCDNGATCLDQVNDFDCKCVDDWIGRYCQDTRTTSTSTTPLPHSVTVNVVSPTMWIIVGACVGGGLFIVIIITVVAVCISRKRKQKNKQEVKTIAQQFSGFWKKRTLRGSKYIKDMEEDSQAGLPSAPSAHRPDLIESTAVFDEMKTDEYAELPCQTMTLKTGMESWHSYISELEMSKVIERALIAKLNGEKKTMTSAWMYEPAEVARLQELMIEQDDNVPLLLQEAEYHIQENDGTIAVGKTIGDSQEPRVLAIGKTRTYLIAAVALAASDRGKVRKEVQWIVDHISGEGY